VNLWEWAVEVASISAANGQKLSPKDVFFAQLSATMTKLKASGTGGGGGSSGQWAQPTGGDLAATDYYQAMMQVLGDTSGIGQVG
jgi:hypothetical protein